MDEQAEAFLQAVKPPVPDSQVPPDESIVVGGKVNRQLYENSPLSGSSVERDWEDEKQRLFNDLKPNLAVVREKPEHRIIIFLKAQGYSNREIAAQTGYSEAWLSQVLRQPWARQRLISELQEAGVDAVQQMLRGAALDSVIRLVAERDNPEARPAERIAASNSLLDRWLGKAIARVESTATITHLHGDVEDIDHRLQELEQQERQLLGKN